jgi:hypothetical protein
MILTTINVYSIVENCGINSAGWCCSEIAAYCGGNCGATIIQESVSMSG